MIFVIMTWGLSNCGPFFHRENISKPSINEFLTVKWTRELIFRLFIYLLVMQFVLFFQVNNLLNILMCDRDWREIGGQTWGIRSLAAFLSQRIWLTIQRGNATTVMGTVSFLRTLEELYYKDNFIRKNIKL